MCYGSILAEDVRKLNIIRADCAYEFGVLIALDSQRGLDRYQAYTLTSLAADLRVTQVVNGNKGIHVMLPKRYLARG